MQTAAVTYPCNCLSGTAHTHTTPITIARQRGFHPGACASAVTHAEGLADAIEGALWGLLVGDALAAPFHWVYTFPELVKLLEKYGPTEGYRSWPMAADFLAAHGVREAGGDAAPPAPPRPASAPSHAAPTHPDSHKYFVRCKPEEQPVDIFNGYARMWPAECRTPYHVTLPLADNTLTARLTSVAMRVVAERGAMDAALYLERYERMLTGGAAEGQAFRNSADGHNDSWIDEAHRVYFRNTRGTGGGGGGGGGGAPSFAAGLDDSCLTGLALSVPALLAYLGQRDMQEVAVRAMLQFTHKSEDMVAQILVLADLLNLLLLPPHIPVGAREGSAIEDGKYDSQGGYTSAIKLLCAMFDSCSFSGMALSDILARGVSDRDAYHGVSPLFSSR
jgi:hypothetical protein